MATIRYTTKIAGALANVDNVTLADPLGAYGVKRDDTGDVLVPVGTVLANTAAGTYEHTFTDVDGVSHTAWVKWVRRGRPHYHEIVFKATNPAASGRIEQAIYAALVADVSLAALVSERIYPSALPEGQSPVISRQAAVTYYGMSGEDRVSTDPLPGIREDRWRITAWGETQAECLEVFAALESLWGRLSGTFAGVTILETYIIQRGDVSGLGLPDEQFDGWGKYLDVMISY